MITLLPELSPQPCEGSQQKLFRIWVGSDLQKLFLKEVQRLESKIAKQI